MPLAMMLVEGFPVGHTMCIWRELDVASPLIPAGSPVRVRLATSQGSNHNFVWIVHQEVEG
jgi:hypothetical protein